MFNPEYGEIDMTEAPRHSSIKAAWDAIKGHDGKEFDSAIEALTLDESAFSHSYKMRNSRATSKFGLNDGSLNADVLKQLESLETRADGVKNMTEAFGEFGDSATKATEGLVKSLNREGKNISRAIQRGVHDHLDAKAALEKSKKNILDQFKKIYEAEGKLLKGYTSPEQAVKASEKLKVFSQAVIDKYDAQIRFHDLALEEIKTSVGNLADAGVKLDVKFEPRANILKAAETMPENARSAGVESAKNEPAKAGFMEGPGKYVEGAAAAGFLVSGLSDENKVNVRTGIGAVLGIDTIRRFMSGNKVAAALRETASHARV